MVVFDNRSIYWETPETAKLFGFDHGDVVFSGLQDHMLVLKKLSILATDIAM